MAVETDEIVHEKKLIEYPFAENPKYTINSQICVRAIGYQGLVITLKKGNRVEVQDPRTSDSEYRVICETLDPLIMAPDETQLMWLTNKDVLDAQKRIIGDCIAIS